MNKKDYFIQVRTDIIRPSEICKGPKCWNAGKRKQIREKLNIFAIAKRPSETLTGSNGTQ
jgi:hypothetical protein